MGNMGFYIISAAMMVVYSAVSWLVVSKLHLGPEIEMVVRLLLLGVAACVFGFVYQWRERKQRAALAAQQPGQAAAAGDSLSDREVDAFLREADRRLAGSRFGKDTNL